MSTHWWMALTAVPPQPDEDAYRRLRKIWADKTRFRGSGSTREHEFVTPRWETHLMTTLWENFSLFEGGAWLAALASAAKVGVDHSGTTRCNWSYGLRDKATKRIADIVIGFDGVEEGLGCYVIEAKRPGGKLTSKDLDPGYYLGFEAIRQNAPFARLIYLVDDREKQRVELLMGKDPAKYASCGVLSWSELGAVQIQLARDLDVPERVRAFVGGAIQYQFCQHGIVPAVLSQTYLHDEPSVADVDRGLRTGYDNHDPQWMMLKEPADSGRARDSRQSAKAPRRCLLPAIPQMTQAAQLLSDATDALLRGAFEEARSLVQEADDPAVMAHVRRLVGAMSPEVHGTVSRPVGNALDARAKGRMPSVSIQRAIFARDGWRCRFCGVKVIAKEARQVLRRTFPDECRWGGREYERHAALYALAASLDHVVPHSRGGRNEEANYVTACTGCQFGRGQWLLEEMDLLDPRLTPPIVDGWDGLSRIAALGRASGPGETGRSGSPPAERIVLSVGGEGGSLELWERQGSELQYRATLNDQTLQWIGEGEELRRETGWADLATAMRMVDRYRWTKLRPAAVDPAHAHWVWERVRQDWSEVRPANRDRWVELCQRDDSLPAGTLPGDLES